MHRVNLFNCRDEYFFFSSETDFQMYIAGPTGRFTSLPIHTDPSHAHAHMYVCRSGDSKALSTGGRISQQSRGQRQTRLPFSDTSVCVCECIFNTHAHTYQCSFRSRCPGLSVAVLNDANISNEIPIFSSREQGACVSSLMEG